MIKKLLSNKVAQNAGWIILGKVLQLLISLAITLLTARYLGPSNYGLINYASAYTAFFSALCTLGINSVLVKELVDNPLEEGKVLGTAMLLKLVSSFFSCITIVLIVSVLDKGEMTTILVVALNCLSVLFNVLDTYRYWFQSKLKSKVTAICTLIAYTITSLYKLFLVMTGKSVEYFSLALSIDYFLLGILLYISYKAKGGQKLSFSWQYGKSILSRSWHFILPSLMVSIYAQTDKLMLKQMISTTEIGYYSTALSLCTMWCFVLSAIIDSMYPPIIEAHKKNKEDFDRKNKILYAIIFYLCTFVSIIFTVFADLIICILYGKAYLPAAIPLRIITWYTSFSYLGVAKNAWIVCNNKQSKLIYIYASAAISNVILNLFFIPTLGAAGAAIASLVAQIITVAIAPLFIKDLKENTLLIFDAILLKGVLPKGFWTRFKKKK